MRAKEQQMPTRKVNPIEDNSIKRGKENLKKTLQRFYFETHRACKALTIPKLNSQPQNSEECYINFITYVGENETTV